MPAALLPGGALLPHLFTLTSTLPQGGMFSVALAVQRSFNPPSRTLSGTLLCGVRTFLPPCGGRPSGPAANRTIIGDADEDEGRVSLRPSHAAPHEQPYLGWLRVYQFRALPENRLASGVWPELYGNCELFLLG